MAQQAPTDEAPSGPFGRVPQLAIDELDDDQEQLLEFLKGSLGEPMSRFITTDDGHVAGGFNYLLIDPNVGRAFSHLGTTLGVASKHVSPRLRELTILQTAQALQCEYEWQAHTRIGRVIGITETEIDAIANDGDSPSFDQRERVMRRLVKTLVVDKNIPESFYQEALAELGLPLLFDLVMLAGFYLMMSMPIAAFGSPGSS